MKSDNGAPFNQPSGTSTVKIITPLNQHTTGLKQDEIRVLHVDDEPDFAEMAGSFLERISDDFAVTSEQSAEEGLRRLEGEVIDCVVSDYQMPETDGLEFLETVRDRDPDMPFILFTGRGSEQIASDAISVGVTDYLQKGTGTDQYEVLANRIRNAVGRYRTEQELWTTLSWYQRLVEQELAGIYLIQHEEFMYVNEKFAEIFDYEQEELIGRSVLTIIAAEDEADVVENLQQREAGDIDSIRYTLTGRRKDGSHVDLEVHGGAIEFEGKSAVMGILLDVSERD